jgi:hypothetical protein
MSEQSYLYRFRSIESLIGVNRQELQENYIYFAPPESQNDALEGFVDVFWQGDEIVWENLIKNFLRVLHDIFFYVSNMKIDKESGEELDELMLMTESYLFSFDNWNKKDLYQKLYQYCFAIKDIKKIPKLLAKKEEPVQRIELMQYFTIIHFHALNYLKHFYLNLPNIKLPKNILGKLPSFNLSKKEQHILEEVYLNAYNRIIEYITPKISVMPVSQNFVDLEFPNIYLSMLNKLIYNKWYISCFMTNCEKSSIWGYYANGHRDVCLKFKIECIGDTLSFVNSKNLPAIQKVDYIKDYISINFFKSFGHRFVASGLKRQLLNNWYTNEKGKKSNLANHLMNDDLLKNWTTEYPRFSKKISISKLLEWSGENEYRMVLYDNYNGYYNAKESRKLKYDLKDLDAIIFGMKTSIEDKLKVISILKEKELYHKVKVFQAYYSHSDKCIKYS